jgi:hypothetical protein
MLRSLAIAWIDPSHTLKFKAQNFKIRLEPRKIDMRARMLARL